MCTLAQLRCCSDFFVQYRVGHSSSKQYEYGTVRGDTYRTDQYATTFTDGGGRKLVQYTKTETLVLFDNREILSVCMA